MPLLGFVELMVFQDRGKVQEDVNTPHIASGQSSRKQNAKEGPEEPKRPPQGTSLQKNHPPLKIKQERDRRYKPQFITEPGGF